MSAKSAFGRAPRRALLSASAAVLALALSHQAAQAQQAYDVSFSNGVTISGTAIATTGSSPSPGAYLVDYITGSMTDTSVDANAHALTGPINFENTDNLIYSASPNLDGQGLGFSSNGHDYGVTYFNPGYAIGTQDGAWLGGNTVTITVHPSVDTAHPSYDETSTPLAQSTVVFEGGTFKPTTGYTLSAPVILSSLGGTVDATNGAVVLTGDIVGPGGLTTTSSQFSGTGGAGWVTLTGTNTYTGGTTVGQGSLLNLGGGGTTGSVTGDIADNGWLQFDRSDDTTFAGVISGTGNQEKFDSSTLTLTGANTNTGTFYVVDGTLQVGDGATSGSWKGDIAGPVTFNRADTVTFGGVLSDINVNVQRLGSLTQAGSGTLILTGDNTYTGGTTINQGGTLQIGDGGTSGSIGSGDVVNNGHLVFDRSDTLTYGGQITGAGDLTVGGTGTFVLTGDSTYNGGTTINAGATLQLGNGGTTGSVKGNITDNGTLAFDYSGSKTVDNAISGTGGVTVAGGTLILTNTNTYKGVTVIDSGATLALSGSGSIAQSGDPLVNGTFDISGAGGNVSVVSLSGSGSVLLGNNTLTLSSASETFSGVISSTGSGGLDIQAGTEVLTGANTYTGKTTIENGATLQLGDGATNGTVAGAIVDSGLLKTDYSGSATLAGNISGLGSIELVAGTTVVTGSGTVGGTVTVDQGATLQWGDGTGVGFLLGTTNTLNNGSIVVDLGSGALGTTLAISGSGSLTVHSGEFGTNADNGYTGLTTIDAAGELMLSGSGSIASSSGVVDNGKFDISLTSSGASITTLSGSGSVVLGVNTLTLTKAAGTFSGVISDSGSGGLDIQAGTEVLTGTNTYTGKTTIETGATLQLGNGGTTGSVAGDIADDGSLVFNHAANTTYGGSITGTGSVTVAPTGYGLYFTGTNTYTGGTTIGAGTALFLGNGGTSGSIKGDVVLNGGDLVFDRSDDVTFSGLISGTGGWITLLGGDTVTLTADNTFTGPPNVLAGSTLQLGAGGTTGSVSSSTINDFGAVAFDHSNNITWAGVIQQAGSVTIGGAGVVTFTGANTYTGGTGINAGATLQLGAGGTTGSIVGAVVDNGTLVFDRSDTVTFNSAVSGSGKLTQAGFGVTILDGVNTVSGLTTISAGTLEVGDAAHPGAVLDSHLGGVSVGAAGTLAGHGTILGAVSNTSGGVVSPGGSIGTLTVGSYTQGASSTLAIEVSPTQASQLNVTGAASLNGKLSLAFDAGTYSPHIYEILAAGSVSGTFSSVDMSGTQQAGLVYGIAYKSDQVDLVMAPTRNALVYGDVSTATLDRAQSFASLVEDRFGDAVCANGAADKPRGGDDACHGMGAWAQAIASSDHAGAVGAGYGFNNRGAGFVGGIDHRWGRGATLGVAFGYQDDSLSISGASASATGHAYFGSVYGRWSVGAVKLDGQAFYMNSDWSLSRGVTGYGKASSSPNGGTEGFLLQASAPFGQSGVSPYVRVAYAQFNRDSVNEAGVGSLGYEVASASSSSTLGEIGFTYAHVFGEAGGRQLVPSLRLGVQKDFSSRSQTLDASLDGVSGSAFAVSYDKPGQTAGVADLSLKAQLTPSFELTGELRGRFGDNVSEGTATVGGAYRF